MIKALCNVCTVGSRFAGSIGDGTSDRCNTCRNIYSSATSTTQDEEEAVVSSMAVLYAAPARNIARRRGLETAPGSKLGEWTIGKCQWNAWKKTEMKAEILDTPKTVVRCIMSSSGLSLRIPMDLDVSTNSEMISVNWLDSFDGKRASER